MHFSSRHLLCFRNFTIGMLPFVKELPYLLLEPAPEQRVMMASAERSSCVIRQSQYRKNGRHACALPVGRKPLLQTLANNSRRSAVGQHVSLPHQTGAPVPAGSLAPPRETLANTTRWRAVGQRVSFPTAGERRVSVLAQLGDEPCNRLRRH
jgi:hypothetical protein